jgi:hypothetical protein
MPFWGDYSSDAMWNPRWIARMRRVAPPMIPVGQMAGTLGGSALEGILKKGLAMLPDVNVPKVGTAKSDEGAGTDEVLEFITGWFQLGGGMADGAIAGEIEKSTGYLH